MGSHIRIFILACPNMCLRECCMVEPLNIIRDVMLIPSWLQPVHLLAYYGGVWELFSSVPDRLLS